MLDGRVLNANYSRDKVFLPECGANSNTRLRGRSSKFWALFRAPFARAFAIGIAQLVYVFHFRLRQVGMRNLEMVFPEKSEAERKHILRGVFTSLGRQLAELCQFPRYTPENIDDVVVYDGLENYERAYARGKGVLFRDRPLRWLGAFGIRAFPARALAQHRDAADGQSLSRSPAATAIARYMATESLTKTISSADCWRR